MDGPHLCQIGLHYHRQNSLFSKVDLVQLCLMEVSKHRGDCFED